MAHGATATDPCLSRVSCSSERASPGASPRLHAVVVPHHSRPRPPSAPLPAPLVAGALPPPQTQLARSRRVCAAAPAISWRPRSENAPRASAAAHAPPSLRGRPRPAGRSRRRARPRGPQAAAGRPSSAPAVPVGKWGRRGEHWHAQAAAGRPSRSPGSTGTPDLSTRRSTRTSAAQSPRVESMRSTPRRNLSDLLR